MKKEHLVHYQNLKTYIQIQREDNMAEMIDILNKLREYQEQGHEVSDAIKSTEMTQTEKQQQNNDVKIVSKEKAPKSLEVIRDVFKVEI